MKLKALSNYDGDKSTRFGDCILIYDLTSMIVYDCGHGKHAEYVESFLQKNATITSVSIVVSHNDSDHTNGVCSLLEWLSDQGKYKVTVYTHQYLKHSSTILKKVDDGRRNKDSISQAILIEFDNIKKIIEKAKELNISAQEALDGVCISTCTIVGPTADEFTDVATKAIDNRVDNKIGEGDAAETVMNAASVQLKCTLDDGKTLLLCGDAIGAVGLLSALSSMIAIDTLAGAICALVFILNEFWPDKVKQQIIYKDMPSDTVFTDIASGKIDAAGFDLAKAKEMFAHLSNAPANQQTAEWNDLLRKCKDAERGNVIDAERMQLMTRDICMSTISLLVMTLIAFGVLAVAYMSLVTAIKILYIPLVYLVIMWFVTKKAAKSRANRIVVLVIKNAVQGL